MTKKVNNKAWDTRYLQKKMEEATEKLREDILKITAGHVLTSWHANFMKKAYGGTDEHGNSWPPLKESTVQKKLFRKNQEEYKRKRVPSWEETRNSLHQQFMMGGMGFDSAMAKANDLAWGAAPPVENTINVETSALEKSLSPEGNEHSVRGKSGDTITLGTSRPKAGEVNALRRFLPTSDEASVYVKRAAIAAVNEMADELRRG